uniref:Uncharacterized protein n=1 Tax=Tanacetum cinerariifolium TaxID=118510 RepID=A0A6L2NDI5_TANCI|nr:hypothetical protein [Tanacetum cinerariifolium]
MSSQFYQAHRCLTHHNPNSLISLSWAKSTCFHRDVTSSSSPLMYGYGVVTRTLPKPQVLGVDRRSRVVSVLKVKTARRSLLLPSSYADPLIALKVSSIGSSGVLFYFGSENQRCCFQVHHGCGG